jgi:FkbM family methyltransferase
MLKRVARWPLRIIPKATVLPILTGANRGLQWIVGAGQHGCWLGSYERVHIAQIVPLIRSGMIAFDVGAHSGYYTLLLSRLVGKDGRVIAFEPSRLNADNLRRHLELNRVCNVEVVEAAVTDRAGTAYFHDESYLSRLSETGRVVQTVRLDDFGVPDFIKMDIEGAETLALKGAENILKAVKTTWFIALHEEASECPGVLMRNGYSIKWTSPFDLISAPKKDPTDND